MVKSGTDPTDPNMVKCRPATSDLSRRVIYIVLQIVETYSKTCGRAASFFNEKSSLYLWLLHQLRMSCNI
jgi:hypothetical protein